MRNNDGSINYLLGDHLGSVSTVVNASGEIISQSRYLPFGEVLWEDGTSPTDYTYTGQRSLSDIGLMNYNARFYDPMLSRFTSPDSIIPEPGSVIGYNRYAYVNNNPIRYTDPSGHIIPEDIDWPWGRGYEPTKSGTTSNDTWNDEGFFEIGDTGFYIHEGISNITTYEFDGAILDNHTTTRSDVNSGTAYEVGDAVEDKKLCVTDMGILGLTSIPAGVVGGLYVFSSEVIAAMGVFEFTTWFVTVNSVLGMGQYAGQAIFTNETLPIIGEAMQDVYFYDPESPVTVVMVEYVHTREVEDNGEVWYPYTNRAVIVIQNQGTGMAYVTDIQDIYVWEIKYAIEKQLGE